MVENQIQKFLYNVHTKKDKLIVDKNANTLNGEVNLAWAKLLLKNNSRDYILVEREVETQQSNPGMSKEKDNLGDSEIDKGGAIPKAENSASDSGMVKDVESGKSELEILKELADSNNIPYRSNITVKGLKKKLRDKESFTE